MALHFIGFRDDRYWSARRVFGAPDFFHRYWDARAMAEIASGDTALFATGSDADMPNPNAFNDSAVF